MNLLDTLLIATTYLSCLYCKCEACPVQQDPSARTIHFPFLELPLALFQNLGFLEKFCRIQYLFPLQSIQIVRIHISACSWSTDTSQKVLETFDSRGGGGNLHKLYTLKASVSPWSTGHGIGVLVLELTRWLKLVWYIIRSYYRCCCINEPVIFSYSVHLKLGHWFHALLKVCSDHDDTAPLIKLYSYGYILSW